MNDQRGEIIIYQAKDGKTALEVKLQQETVWLSLNQMADLFERDKSVISRHLHNIFKTKELERSSTVAFFATVQNEGGRFVDGNKRIAAALFICFLQRNSILFCKNGMRRIDENALVALTLMIAASRPQDKDAMIKVILNLLA
jgi:prophage maintenance system killer protein